MRPTRGERWCLKGVNVDGPNKTTPVAFAKQFFSGGEKQPPPAVKKNQKTEGRQGMGFYHALNPNPFPTNRGKKKVTPKGVKNQETKRWKVRPIPQIKPGPRPARNWGEGKNEFFQIGPAFRGGSLGGLNRKGGWGNSPGCPPRRRRWLPNSPQKIQPSHPTPKKNSPLSLQGPHRQPGRVLGQNGKGPTFSLA